MHLHSQYEDGSSAFAKGTLKLLQWKSKSLRLRFKRPAVNDTPLLDNNLTEMTNPA